MATDVTSSITSDVSFSSKYQLTANDDTLIISGATITLLEPQGEIFTNEGNDVVQIEDALIVTDTPNLSFYLGSGNDTLTVKNTILSVPIQTGNGNDTVIVDGTIQTKVTLNKKLTFGDGDDILELISILENVGGIDFGPTGTGTLRFNGGTLCGAGTINGITSLDVTLSGGTTGRSLLFSGEQTNITLNGNFLGTTNTNISVSGGNITLSVGNNVRTNVSFALSQANLIQTSGGALEFSECNFTADDSNVSLHDFVINNGELTGSNTTWTIEKGDFSNSSKYNGAMHLTGGTLDFQDIGFRKNSGCALLLSETKMNGSQLSLEGNNSYYNAMVTSGADITIVDFRATNNSSAGAVIQNGGVMSLTSAYFSGNYMSNGSYASGGAIVQRGGGMTLTSAIFSRNYIYGSSAFGGAVYLSGAVANMENVAFVSNYATGFGKNSFSSSHSWVGYAFGGAIYLEQTTLNYVVTSGAKVMNIGNRAVSSSGVMSRGGWLCVDSKSVLNITVEEGGVLTIGEAGSTGSGNDSIDGTADSLITKNGTGKMLINSQINSASVLWSITEGTLELAELARTILLDKWSIGTNGKLVLSTKNDGIYMNMSKIIGTIDMGGGSDTINTSGYALTDGTILFSDLMIDGGGRISVNLMNRSTTQGSTLRLNGCYLDSDFTGNNYADRILINADTNLTGVIDMGGGDNVITATAQAFFTKTLKAGSGNDVMTFSDASFEDLIDLGDGNNELTINGTLQMTSVAAGSGNDVITLKKASTISGEISLGAGVNAIHVRNALTANKVRITESGETTIYVYYGSTLTNNTLTVYSDENANRDSVTLEWSAQTDLDKVRILVSGDSSFDTYEFSVELYNQSKSFTLNLQQGYFIQFQAQDEDGWKQRLLDDTVAPDQVTGVNFNGKSLTWDATHDNLGGNGVKEYHVEISEDASFANPIISETVTGTEYTPASLPETALYFRVSAEDYTNNIGAWSETISGTYDVTPPSRPSGGKSTVNGYSATMSWSAASDDGTGVARYEYRVAADSDYGQIVTDGTTEACTFSVEGLNYGTYYWQVRAVDAAGNAGNWSLSKSFTTVDLVAPGMPTNLDYGIEDETSLIVIWDPAADDVPLGSGLKGYEIQLATDSAFGNIVKTVSVTDTEAMIEHLPNATYYMHVCSVDNAGNKSVWTDTVDFTISGGEPGPGPAPGDKAFFTGDFNGDGTAMLAVQENAAVTVYLNGEPWGLGVSLDDGWTIAGVGDFGGDGFDDFLRVHASGLVMGDMSSGNGLFNPQVLNFLNEGWDILGVGDFNGNGTDDVLIANPTAASETVGLLGYWESGMTWTLINGYSAEWECIATGDFNADGKCDMLWRNSFVGDGDLTYNAYCTWIVEDPVDWRMVSVANPDEWNFLCSGDFDGNGMNDIAMINDVGVVGIWGVNDGWLSSWSILSAVTPEWQLAGVADFNGDGTDDIAWANTDTGLVGAWQIENKELASWQTIVNLA